VKLLVYKPYCLKTKVLKNLVKGLIKKLCIILYEKAGTIVFIKKLL